MGPIKTVHVKTRPLATAAVLAALLTAVAVVANQADSLISRAEPVAIRAGAANLASVRIGVVLNYLDNPFFVAIYQGLRTEATHLNVHLTVRSVTSNADLAAQAAQARVAVAERDDCMVVNPITATNLVTALRGVTSPIVDVDSPIDPAAATAAGVRIQTYIGTDDFASGRLAGARMAALLPGGGDVALVGGIADNVNSGVRLSGFEAGIRGSHVHVVVRVNADYDRTKAQIAAERILSAHPRLSGFYAVSDDMVLGIVDALRDAGKIGNLTVIGNDGSAEALDHIRGGSISADVSQYPYVMGKMAVEACVAAARGGRLPARVDAPIALLTQHNVARAIAAFPKPLQRYSDPFTQLLRTGG
jgi:ribose transport system substrate-binding protein